MAYINNCMLSIAPFTVVVSDELNPPYRKECYRASAYRFHSEKLIRSLASQADGPLV